MAPKILQMFARLFVRASTVGLSRGPHLTRYTMYRHLAQHRANWPNEAKVLSISGSNRLCELMGFSHEQITEANYPEESLLGLSYADDSFDFLVADQVLEHVEGNPLDAFAESFRVVKAGGLVLHTTCFIQPIHWGPVDLWRFSPDALAYLAKTHGTTVDVGGWGNGFVWPLASLGLQFQPVPHARWHPFHWVATKNDPNSPIMTWVLVKKELEADVSERDRPHDQSGS